LSFIDAYEFLLQKGGDMNFDHDLTRIQVWLTEEERAEGRGIADLIERQARRSAIDADLARLCAAVHRQITRLKSLPPLPDLSCIRWAQHVLASPASRLLVLDTVFPGPCATLVQVLLLDMRGQICLHRCLASAATLSPAEVAHLGISAQDLQQVVSIPQLWPELLDALRGCYLLTCDLRQVRLVLEREAASVHLETPVLLGEDLLPWYARYYQAFGFIELASLCRLIGHPLPPLSGALERAQGHLALLHAMAQGVIQVQSQEISCGSDKQEHAEASRMTPQHSDTRKEDLSE
jgi:hypothetical protein